MRMGRAGLALAGGLACLASGCAERGDFGRVKQSVWNEALGVTGTVAATVRREPVSSLLRTDEETVLRDRAWRFLVPAHDLAWFQRILSELVATRILPAAASQPDIRSYYEALLASAGTSPSPLYRRLSEDIAADTRLLPAFVASAERVLAADRTRLKVLARISRPTPEEAIDVHARVTENRCLIAWVASATGFRAQSYAYALERLAIGSPELQAIAVERSLDRYLSAKTMVEALGVGPIAEACRSDLEPGLEVPIARAPIVAKG